MRVECFAQVKKSVNQGNKQQAKAKQNKKRIRHGRSDFCTYLRHLFAAAIRKKSFNVTNAKILIVIRPLENKLR